MKVFSIKGKFEQNERYSQLPADFIGHFVLDESGEVKGYMEVQYKSHYDNERFIYGRYDESSDNLVYLQMTTERDLSPLLYVFPNLKEEGFWAAMHSVMQLGRFYIQGKAKVTITEDASMSVDEILSKYNKIIEDNWSLNVMLIESGIVESFMGDIFYNPF